MNRFLLILICMSMSQQVSIAQSGNATSPEHTVGSVQAAKEIEKSKSYIPPTTNQLPPPGHKAYKRPVAITHGKAANSYPSLRKK